MFTVLYNFKVNSNKQEEFIEAWTKLTQLIYEYEGSYGSRLHKVNDELYIGYAIWPDRNTWDQSGNNLPESAGPVKKVLRDSCSEINTEYEMTIVRDLLQSNPFKKF